MVSFSRKWNLSKEKSFRIWSWWKYDAIFLSKWCLLSKFFLDHQTLYYVIKIYLFLPKVTRKAVLLLEISLRKSFVCCLMIILLHKRIKFGWVLVNFKYLIPRQDQTGPSEKSLSDPGCLYYLAYWHNIITEYFSLQPQ